MIRKADISDIPALLDFGADFIADLKHPSGIPIDSTSLIDMLKNLIEGEDGAIFICEDGAIGGLVFKYYFNHSHKTAQELFWWVTPEGRHNDVGRKLLMQFMSWAKEKDASSLTMIHLENQNSDKMQGYYESRGFVRVETSYVRKL